MSAQKQKQRTIVTHDLRNVTVTDRFVGVWSYDETHTLEVEPIDAIGVAVRVYETFIVDSRGRCEGPPIRTDQESVIVGLTLCRDGSWAIADDSVNYEGLALKEWTDLSEFWPFRWKQEGIMPPPEVSP